MKLPAGYREFEYIQSDGRQYIDTGLTASSATKISCKIEVLSGSPNTAALFGSRTENGAGDSFILWSISGTMRSDYASETLNIPVTAVGIHEITKNGPNVLVDGHSYAHAQVSFTNKVPITIGVLNQSGGIDTRFSHIRIYNFLAEASENANLIPSEDPDGNIGVYDIARNKFINGSGTAKFTLGPEVIYQPGPISKLTYTIDGTNVSLSWSAGENAESYNVYRDDQELPGTTGTQYRDSNVPYGVHTYSVETVNRYGVSEKVSISVTLEEKAAVPDFSKPTIVYLLDKNYDAYDAVDKFKSLLWTVRFTKAGEFELYVPADLEIIKRFHEGDYAQIEDSDRLMVIEDINLQTDAEDGDYLIISGRSLESILERRIIWGMTVITGNFQNGIKTLLERNVISPAIESRRIPNFTFKESTDSRITELTVEAQYFGENLYEEIEKLCEEKKVGFRVLPKGSGGFEFSLYAGEDRSYDQIKNPWVVFAPNYENLQSSNYLYSKKNFKNATLVGGQGENWSRDTVEVTSDSSSGLDRRETFTDASGVTNDTSGIENDETLTEEEKQAAITALTEEYNEQLKQKGQEELAKTSITETFDGEIDTSLQYQYRKDFDLGDIVQIVNAYGMEASTRVSEIVISHDTTGKTIVPTFTVRTDEKGDEV